MSLIVVGLCKAWPQGMAGQSGWERRGNQGEKRRPWRTMVAPNPDRCKPPVTVPRAAIVARRDCIRLRLGRDIRLLGCCCRNCAVPRNVGQCRFCCKSRSVACI